MNNTDEREISLEDVFNVLAKRWKFIVFPSVVMAVMVALVVSNLPKKYESYSLIRPGFVGNTIIESIEMTREIMNSVPSEEKIFNQLRDVKEIKSIAALKNTIHYEEKSGLLKISALSSTPEHAAKIVSVATGVVMARHENLYKDSLNNLVNSIKFVKSNINPTPISSQIVDYKSSPSIVEISPFISSTPYPLAVKRQSVVLSFLLVLCINIFIAFYLEIKEKK